MDLATLFSTFARNSSRLIQFVMFTFWKLKLKTAPHVLRLSFEFTLQLALGTKISGPFSQIRYGSFARTVPHTARAHVTGALVDPFPIHAWPRRFITFWSCLATPLMYVVIDSAVFLVSSFRYALYAV